MRVTEAQLAEMEADGAKVTRPGAEQNSKLEEVLAASTAALEKNSRLIAQLAAKKEAPPAKAEPAVEPEKKKAPPWNLGRARTAYGDIPAKPVEQPESIHEVPEEPGEFEFSIIRNEKVPGAYKPIQTVLVRDEKSRDWRFDIHRDDNVAGAYKPILSVTTEGDEAPGWEFQIIRDKDVQGLYKPIERIHAVHNG